MRGKGGGIMRRSSVVRGGVIMRKKGGAIMRG